MSKLHINLCVTEERAFDTNSVEYGEIALVRDRWGKQLLQVKDQKSSNLKMPRKRKMRNVNIAEDHNSQQLLHFVPPASDDGDDKPHDEHGDELVPPAIASAPALPPPVLRDTAHFVVPSLRVAPQHQLPAPAPAQPLIHDPAPFKLLPAAEISSILNPKTGTLQYAKDSAAPASRNTAAPQKQLRFESPPRNETGPARKPIVYTRSDDMKIKALKAQLAALEANRDASSGCEYELVDVSMNPNGDDNEGLPEIRLCPSKDKRLFEFEQTRVVASRGDLGRYGTHVPQESVRKVRAGVPRISPISFYQGVAAPPSARAVKGKYRAAPTSIPEESPDNSHQPSSPLHAYGEAYTRQRYLTNQTAGPSRETYL